jgi:hypothetical protein
MASENLMVFWKQLNFNSFVLMLLMYKRNQT